MTGRISVAMSPAACEAYAVFSEATAAAFAEAKPYGYIPHGVWISPNRWAEFCGVQSGEPSAPFELADWNGSVGRVCGLPVYLDPSMADDEIRCPWGPVT